jgi:hypothetical protein
LFGILTVSRISHSRADLLHRNPLRILGKCKIIGGIAIKNIIALALCGDSEFEFAVFSSRVAMIRRTWAAPVFHPHGFNFKNHFW